MLPSVHVVVNFSMDLPVPQMHDAISVVPQVDVMRDHDHSDPVSLVEVHQHAHDKLCVLRVQVPPAQEMLVRGWDMAGAAHHVGSSRRRMSGQFTSARAIVTLCCSPPDS
mmetsp:Transcript_31121/g.99872  ORF Transcript_31121/g.99872 Transcript_31121/m.99872 type:complete len:110 (+) Transcript_31121:2004-2333(+)